MEADKTLRDTAQRKLKEKTGVYTSYLEQVESFGSASRDPRGWSVTVAYLALISSDNIKLSKNESSEEIMWISVDELFEKNALAFDHQTMLKVCMSA